MIKPITRFALLASFSIFTVDQALSSDEEGFHTPITHTTPKNKRSRDENRNDFNSPASSNPDLLDMPAAPAALKRKQRVRKLELESRASPQVRSPAPMKQNIQSPDTLKAICARHDNILQEDMECMIRDQNRFKDIIETFFVGLNTNNETIHPSENTLEKTCETTKVNFASCLRKTVATYKFDDNDVFIETVEPQRVLEGSGEFQISKLVKTEAVGDKLNKLFSKFRMTKLWINAFFNQAQTEHKAGQGNIFQYNLLETHKGFEKMMESLEKALFAANFAHNEAYVVWPHNLGSSSYVLNFQKTWQETFLGVETVIKQYLNTLRDTFVTYVYSTGSGAREMEIDLKQLQEKNIPTNNHLFGKIDSLEKLNACMDLIRQTCNGEEIGKQLVNRTSLTHQIETYFHELYPNLQQSQDLRSNVSNGISTIQNSLLIETWNSFSQANDTLGNHIVGKFFGGETEEKATYLYETGQRLLFLYDLLSAFKDEPEHTNIFFRSIEVLVHWKSQVDSFQLANPVNNRIPMILKTSSGHNELL